MPRLRSILRKIRDIVTRRADDISEPDVGSEWPSTPSSADLDDDSRRPDSPFPAGGTPRISSPTREAGDDSEEEEDDDLRLAIALSKAQAIEEGLLPRPSPTSPLTAPQRPNGQPQPGPSPSAEAQRRCTICWDADANAACVPCGHICGCYQCLRLVKRQHQCCPVCRAALKDVLKVYWT